MSKLDFPQILKRSFDETSGALKTVPASSTSFEIELNKADGDSVYSYPNSQDTSASGIDNTFSSEIIGAITCNEIKTIQLYVKTTDTIVGPQVLTLEVSPVTSGDFWVATSITVTPSTTLNATVASSVGTICARRFRVTTAAAITSGTYSLTVFGLGA